MRSRHFCSPNSSFSADIKKRAGATEKQCEFSFPTLVAWERNVAKLSPAALRPGYPPLSVFWARRSRFSRGGQLSHSASPPPPKNAAAGHPGGDSLRSPPSPTIGSPMAEKSFFAMISESDAAQKKLPLPIVFFLRFRLPPFLPRPSAINVFSQGPFSSSRGRETASRKFSVPPNHQIRQRAKKHIIKQFSNY